MSKAKGEAGIDDARAFIQAFPLQGQVRIISVDQFDQWAESCGYYAADCEQDRKLNLRNRLRQKINISASSDAWLTQEGFGACFHVAVDQHGKSYKIQHPEDALSQKATQLPRQIKSFAGTKRNAIKALHNSVDLTQLPPAMQFRINALDREVDRFLRQLDHQKQEMEREFKAIGHQLQLMVDNKQLQPSNGGVKAFLAVAAATEEPELDYNAPDEEEPS